MNKTEETIGGKEVVLGALPSDLEVSDLGMSYFRGSEEVSVFSKLSYTFKAGETHSISGASGIGKSTLLHLLGGLDIPSTGSVRLGAVSLSDLVRARKDIARFRLENIGFVFQFHHLLPEFDAVENVAMPLLVKGVSMEAARKSASELLGQMGLSHRLLHRPSTLSGGEQQRVAIARALINRPKVLLADEPTGNLDRKTAEEILTVLLNISSEYGSTVILVTHSPEIALRTTHQLELHSSGLRPK